MRPQFRTAVSLSARILAGFSALILTTAVRADQLQNAAVNGSQSFLSDNGFGNFDQFDPNINSPLNGDLIGVADIEAGGGLANVAGTNANTAPNSSLKNGNPDLPFTSVNEFQFVGSQIPTNGSNINGVAVGNHATEVTGVIVGQGMTNAADTGIATGSTVYEAGIPDTTPATQSFNPGGYADLIQKSIQQGASTVNLSLGYFQGTSLTFSFGGGNPNFNLSGFPQATDGMGDDLYLAKGGGTTTNIANAQTYNVTLSNNVAATVPIPIYALGANGLPMATNNGNSFQSQYLDWQANTTNTLMVVAGNEGPQFTRLAAGQAYFAPAANGGAPFITNEYGAPSDAYNIINVAATGVRTLPGALSYDQASSYNTSNATSDGRIGVDMVAPGGDPGASFTYNLGSYTAFLNGAGNTAASSAAVPANGFIDQFQTTAGGVGATASDTYNGKGPGGNYKDVTTTSAYSTLPAGNIFGLPANTIRPSAIDGTSFAAPLVAGASAIVTQFGSLASAQNINATSGDFPFARFASDATDHRVLKAIMLNGASKYNPDGTQLLRSTGTPWTASAPSQGAKPLPPNLLDLSVGSTTNTARSGLDPQLGTGQLDVLGSLTNFAAGEQGPGAPATAKVEPIGWDYENVAANAAANTTYTYDFHYSGAGSADYSAFQATLCWDAPVNITANAGADDANGNPTFQAGNAANSTDFSRGAFTDLDLYFFEVNPNGTLVELGASNSNIDNVQHIFDQPLDGNGDPTTLGAGNYQLDVVAPNGVGGTDVPYGLAWSFVPEPSGVIFLALPVALLARRRKVIA